MMRRRRNLRLGKTIRLAGGALTVMIGIGIVLIGIGLWLAPDNDRAAVHSEVTVKDRSVIRSDVNAKKVLAKLDELEVHKPDSIDGYDRDKFGPAWYDEDENGCDTRVICTFSSVKPGVGPRLH